jgi:hypothetical protein
MVWTKRFVVQVGISMVVLVVGFGALLFGTPDRANAILAAGGIGWVFGFWMRDS